MGEMGGSSPDSLMDSGNAGEHDNYDEILSNPINTRNDIGISDQELVTMSTKEINKLLKKSGIPKERQKEQKEHETYLMKIEEDKAKQGQELGVKNLLANRTEIKWEKVKEEPTSSIFLNKM